MDNIYVIYSTSHRLLENEINKIVKDNKYSSYNALEVDIDDILDNALYVSLFDDINYMVVKNVSNFTSKKKKSDEEIEEDNVSKKDDKLLNYLNEPNKNTVLIMILTDKMNGTKKISKIVKDKYKYIEIDKFSIPEMKSIVEKFNKANKINMNEDSINYIVNALDCNYDLIMNELDKVLLYDKKNLSLDDISNIISSNVLDNNFKFIDAIIGKDIKRAFKYYDDYLLNKNSPIVILSMLANDFRNMYLIKKLIRNNSKNEIMKLLDIKYPFQMDKLANFSFNYKEDVLEDYLLYLCDMDYNIKIGKITDRIALELFILKICN